jgi:type I restriction enzyme S subunit
LDVQRRIADFLDDQVGRVDAVLARRNLQLELVERRFHSFVLDTVAGGHLAGERRASGIPWLGTTPNHWKVATVGAAYEVVLGKMLDEKKATGLHPVPYLRNTNVQWDHIDISDLKVMDIAQHEKARYTVQSGDLLICEGGQPGRSAVWDGRVTPIGFQKALHRARPKSDADVRWLLNCLRAATTMDVFGVQSGQTTISHLTSEQLRETKIPIPPPFEVKGMLAAIDREQRFLDSMKSALAECSVLLSERKGSLITAAVTGEFDVTAASSRTADVVLSGVGGES